MLGDEQMVCSYNNHGMAKELAIVKDGDAQS